MQDLPELVDGAQCKRCDAIKPLKEFTRFLTGAEARAQGYAGNYRVKVVGNVCKDCRPRRKPLSKLRAGEIRQRIDSGDVNPIAGAYEIKKRNARAKLTRQVVGTKMAHKRWLKDLREIVRPMSEHITSVDNWIRYQVKRGAPSDAPSVVFMVDYLRTLRTLRAQIKGDHLIKPKRVTATTWEQLIPRPERMELWKKWDALAPDQRHLMLRTPPRAALYRDTEE